LTLWSDRTQCLWEQSLPVEVKAGVPQHVGMRRARIARKHWGFGHCAACASCVYTHSYRRGRRDVGAVGARIGRRDSVTRRKPLAYRRFRDSQAHRTESGDSCAYRFSPRADRQPTNLQGKRVAGSLQMPTNCGSPVFVRVVSCQSRPGSQSSCRRGGRRPIARTLRCWVRDGQGGGFRTWDAAGGAVHREGRGRVIAGRGGWP